MNVTIPIIDWEQHLINDKKEFTLRFKGKRATNCSRESFDFIRTLGSGALGRVYLAREWETGEFYAIKVFKKATVVQRNQTKHVINEKRILQALNCPFTVYLTCAFQDNSHLFLSMPFIPAGDMFRLLKSQIKFEEELAKFYGAQVLLALEYLHYCGIVHRDIKPENLLIDQRGYVRMADFGLSGKIRGRSYTLCGTPEYMAPEIIGLGGYGPAVDWWSYGVLLFELNAGRLPFQGKDHLSTFVQIASGSYRFPLDFSTSLKDLIDNLLQVELSRRYGNMKGGVQDIKDHDWFKGISWLSLLNGTVEAPFIPEPKRPGDTRFFDTFQECVNQVEETDPYYEEFKEF